MPDNDITTAYSILRKLGFKACSIGAECRTAKAIGFGPSPSAHAHLNAIRFIGLYKKSDTLWNISSLRPGHNVNRTTPDVITASDSVLPGPRPGRGRGAFSQTLFPVHIPSAYRLTEAYILLTLRHSGQPLEFFWRSMLTYVIEFLLDDGILDTRDLEPHHRRFIELFANPGDMGMGKIFEDLRSDSAVFEKT